MENKTMTQYVEDGHLGGYIAGGDSYTFCAPLWAQLIRDFQVKSVLDIGCAEGHAMQWFTQQGCEVWGVDGCEIAIRNHLLPQRVSQHDFTTGPWSMEPVDLVWCCEVLEHVEERYLPNLLAAINGRVAAVTAAPPGQSGYHHVNCQPPSYWIAKFAEIGFEYDRISTQRYKAQGEGIGIWFYHNGLVFVKK
jgi:SAM-dependent methyltransferase